MVGCAATVAGVIEQGTGSAQRGTEFHFRRPKCAARKCKRMFQNGTHKRQGIIGTARDFTQLINLTICIG